MPLPRRCALTMYRLATGRPAVASVLACTVDGLRRFLLRPAAFARRRSGLEHRLILAPRSRHCLGVFTRASPPGLFASIVFAGAEQWLVGPSASHRWSPLGGGSRSDPWQRPCATRL